MDMVDLSRREDKLSRNELHDLIRRHYLRTGSDLAKQILDDWANRVEEFIQVMPIEYKHVLHEEQMARLKEKIAAVSRDY